MKGKKVVATLQNVFDTTSADRLAIALAAKFPFFSFTHEAGAAPDQVNPLQVSPARLVLADGPWHIKANLRPSLDQISRFAEGYLQCLLDAAARSATNSWVDGQLAQEEP